MRKSCFLAGQGASEAPGLVYAIVPAHGESTADSIVRQLSRGLAEDHRLSVLLADFCSQAFPLPTTAAAHTGPARLLKQQKRSQFPSWPGSVVPASFPEDFVTCGVYDALRAGSAHPSNIRRLLEHARSRYQVTCADLTGAKASLALEVLRHADSIFMIANSDQKALEAAGHRSAWLRSMGLEDRAGLVLNRVPGGVSGAEAEERTGLPVCAAAASAVEAGSGELRHDLRQLAAWLAAPLTAQPVEQRALCAG